MATRPTCTRWLPAVSGAVAAMLAFAVLPATALADDVLDPGPYSEDSQLSTDAYSALASPSQTILVTLAPMPPMATTRT